jgi:hypothetical protein
VVVKISSYDVIIHTMNDKRKFPELKKALAHIFFHNWSEARYASVSQIIAAMLALSAPIAVGMAAGNLQSGVAASLGGLAIGMQHEKGGGRDLLSSPIYALIAVCAATFIGTALSEKGLTPVICIPVIAATAALFGSISRPLARATTQFIIFLIIAANMSMHNTSPAGMTTLIALGAVWAAALSLLLKLLLNALSPLPDCNGYSKASPLKKYSARQLLRRWRKSLLHLAGWQYTIRITLCLFASEVIRLTWPYDRSYWISLTVAIVVHRDLQAALARTLQRAAGTALGVLLISILLLGMPPIWVTVVLVAVLAGLRPVLFYVNYVVYAAATSPLIILLLDFGKTLSAPVIADRLIATLTGCFIALILGYMVWPKLAGSSQTILPHRK